MTRIAVWMGVGRAPGHWVLGSLATGVLVGLALLGLT